MEDEERGESPAERLIELGAHLGRAGRHRMAALAYASAAGGASGASPRSRADALQLAAYHLHQQAKGERSEDDLLRARALAQKALLFAKTLPDAFTRTMRILALLEAIASARGDDAAFGHTCRAAVVEMRRAAGRGEHVWGWWVYFQTRQLLAAAARVNGTEYALTLAANGAELAEKRGDAASSVGFHLIGAHLRVAAPLFTLDSVAPALQAATTLLMRMDTETVPAGAPLRLARLLLSGLALLRAGFAAQARRELAQDAAHALAVLDRRGAGAMHATKCAWVWAPVPALRALLQHLLACALRPRGDGGAAWVHAERALAAAGVRADSPTADSPVLMKCLGSGAAKSLVVALLDNAARVRLGLVDLSRAAPLVEAAIEASESAPSKVTRCSALLLAAEYCALSGQLEQARVSLRYLDEIEGIGRDEIKRNALGDVLQMAQTHRSLLTGHARGTDRGMHRRDVQYVGRHVRAAALFADGVHHMRNSRILPARGALQEALTLIMGDGDRSAVNEQLVANTLIVQSGLSLLREVIEDADHVPVRDAIVIAERARDVVTEVRSKRQAYKLLSKSSSGTSAASTAHGVARKAMGRLTQAQTAFTTLRCS